MGRVNYVLRAMRVPPGEHDIVFTFDPQSIKTTNTVAMVSVVIIYLLCLGAVTLWVIHIFTSRKEGKEEGDPVR